MGKHQKKWFGHLNVKHEDREQHRSGRVLIWSSVLALGGFAFWASWAEIDQITRASGQVISSSRNQLIQASDGGVLEEIYVKEGAQVKKGQLLAKFDQTRTESAYLESKAKAAALKATLARLHAELFGGEIKFPSDLANYAEFKQNQTTLFVKRQSALNEEIEAYRKSLGLIKEELDMNLPLLKTGDVSRAEVLKLQRQVAEMQSQITNKKNKYLQDSQAEMSKAQEDLAGVEQILAQRKDQLAYTNIKAPMDGVVRNVRMTTRGGVARAGEEIMQIVPIDEDLIFEAKVKPADVAFVKPGLSATMKIDAYDYTIYGSLNGTVSYISADTLSEEARSTNEQPYYRVQVKTKGRNFIGHNSERIELQPGMTATIEIKTGSQTVLRYLTKPITKTISESLGER